MSFIETGEALNTNESIFPSNTETSALFHREKYILAFVF